MKLKKSILTLAMTMTLACTLCSVFSLKTGAVSSVSTNGILQDTITVA